MLTPYFYKRVLASYVTRVQEKTDKKIVVINVQPEATFNVFVFFSGVYNNEDMIKKINPSGRNTEENPTKMKKEIL